MRSHKIVLTAAHSFSKELTDCFFVRQTDKTRLTCTLNPGSTFHSFTQHQIPRTWHQEAHKCQHPSQDPQNARDHNAATNWSVKLGLQSRLMDLNMRRKQMFLCVFQQLTGQNTLPFQILFFILSLFLSHFFTWRDVWKCPNVFPNQILALNLKHRNFAICRFLYPVGWN